MVKKTILNQRIRDEVGYYAQKLQQAGLPVDQLIVFGSQVRGTAKPWSDIDLCVVSKRFGKNRFEERVRLMKLRGLENSDIEPHPYHPRDLADKWDPLAHEIRKYGIVWREMAP